MASGSSAVVPKDTSGSSNVSVILRVKRKREEDPLDALVISHKKLRKLDSSEVKNGKKSVFCFAASSSEKEQSHEKIMDHIRQSQLKQNPFSKLSLSDRHSRMREQHKVESANKRYKLVSKLRALPEEKSSSEKQNEPSFAMDQHEMVSENRLTPSVDHKTNLHIRSDSKDGRTSNIKEYLKEMIQFYDVERKDSSDSDEESPEAIRTCSRMANVITCNGSEMIREQCALSRKEEYVYDWYYLYHCSKEEVDNFNWESLEAYCEQPELVHDILDDSDQEYFDDEDDENEESNWRNDYPDEDEWQSDASSGYEMSSDNECYRYQPIGKVDAMDYDSEDSSQENC